MLKTIDKMKEIEEAFGLGKVAVNRLDLDAHTIKDNLLYDAETIQNIEERRQTSPLPTDSMDLQMRKLDILKQLEAYKDFLPEYQEMVEKLLGKKDEIEKKVEEKRQAGEVVPSKQETENALQEAGNKLQEAIKENPRLRGSYQSTKSFIDNVKPYVGPLLQVAKIVFKILAL